MTRSRHAVSLGLIVFLFIALSGCDSTGANDASADCDSRTGNIMSAVVNGDALCTDIGTALLLEGTEKQLAVVGLFGTSGSGASISFNIFSPAVGTASMVDGLYGTEDESRYYIVSDREGSGSVTITELSDSRAKGTFSFIAIGIDASTNDLSGDQVEVKDGVFDFALSQ